MDDSGITHWGLGAGHMGWVWDHMQCWMSWIGWIGCVHLDSIPLCLLDSRSSLSCCRMQHTHPPTHPPTYPPNSFLDEKNSRNAE